MKNIIKYFHILSLIGLIAFSTSAENNDRTEVKSDSLTLPMLEKLQIGISDVQKRIDTVDAILSKLKTEVTELSENDNFWNMIPSNVLIGIVASFIALFILWICKEIKYLRRYRKLGGNYHHRVDGEIKVGCSTHVQYAYGGKLKLTTTTQKGDWIGSFTMDKNIPTNGSGVYYYTTAREEIGFMYLVIASEKDVINVFPITMSHLTQKVHFYQLVRK